MKKFINISVKITAVLVAFSLLTMLFMPKYIEENNDGRITAEYYREKTPIDVIFAGSSTVQAGVSPMVLYREHGITAYDRSNSSQVIPISLAMIEDAIDTNKPELVVLDVGFIYQPDDYVDEGSTRKSLDTLKWSRGKVKCIKAVMDETESFIDYVFPILRFHSRWNDLSFEDIKYLLYKPSVTYNGQLIEFKKEAAGIARNPHSLDESVYATDRSLLYLMKIINVCEKNDVDLMLMKLPHIEGNWNNAIDTQIAELARDNGIIYKNFLDDFDSFDFDTDNEYSDAQHLNSYGAEKFTKVLGDFITDNYDIPDRRNDEKIKAVFDEKLSEYEKAMEY